MLTQKQESTNLPPHTFISQNSEIAVLVRAARWEKAGIVGELFESEARFVRGRTTATYGLSMQGRLGHRPDTSRTPTDQNPQLKLGRDTSRYYRSARTGTETPPTPPPPRLGRLIPYGASFYLADLSGPPESRASWGAER